MEVESDEEASDKEDAEKANGTRVSPIEFCSLHCFKLKLLNVCTHENFY